MGHGTNFVEGGPNLGSPSIQSKRCRSGGSTGIGPIQKVSRTTGRSVSGEVHRSKSSRGKQQERCREPASRVLQNPVQFAAAGMVGEDYTLAGFQFKPMSSTSLAAMEGLFSRIRPSYPLSPPSSAQTSSQPFSLSAEVDSFRSGAGSSDSWKLGIDSQEPRPSNVPTAVLPFAAMPSNPAFSLSGPDLFAWPPFLADAHFSAIDPRLDATLSAPAVSLHDQHTLGSELRNNTRYEGSIQSSMIFQAEQEHRDAFDVNDECDCSVCTRGSPSFTHWPEPSIIRDVSSSRLFPGSIVEEVQRNEALCTAQASISMESVVHQLSEPNGDAGPGYSMALANSPGSRTEAMCCGESSVREKDHIDRPSESGPSRTQRSRGHCHVFKSLFKVKGLRKSIIKGSRLWRSRESSD